MVDDPELHEISFERSDSSAKIPDNENLLAFCDSLAKPQIPALCRGGSCGTCKVRLIAGRVELETTKALRPGEQEAGWILACSTRVRGDIILDI
jgi:ferredoxin